MDDPKKLFRKTRHSAKFSQKQDETLPEMGEEKKVMELCVPTSAELKIRDLTQPQKTFEIRSSVINMVQNQPFSGKEDPNQHLKMFLQICYTFNIEGVTDNQIRARLFPFSLIGKAHQWLSTLPRGYSEQLAAVTYSIHRQVLFTREDSSFAEQDFNICAVPHGDIC